MDFQRPQKHSLTLKGHRTSVSLEDDFWFAFRDISEELNRPINDLAAEIDEMRGEDCGLASAIRLFVLNDLQDRLTSDDPVA
ncbi:MAG: ribbon-helix-helix domain-containing protein [Epibacterium sp.]|nr:ribbon-helix-helix domain-containing protein [Epibacterium sp.]NQX73069.1 ribbon-helix-helix domain-containing protein [Epibacterium sp.]